MGLMGANKQAKAMDEANPLMPSFSLYRPYIEGNLGAADAALRSSGNRSLQGDTLAGPGNLADTASNGTYRNIQNTGSNVWARR